MTPWKYTDSTNTIVFRILDDGRQESHLTSVLSPEDLVNVLPADPPQIPPQEPSLATQILSDPIQLAELKAALGL